MPKEIKMSALGCHHWTRLFGMGAMLLSWSVLTDEASAASPDDRLYLCSYSVGGAGRWAAVQTSLRYEDLVAQWKANAASNGGASAYCFSRYRKDDPPYQSLQDVIEAAHLDRSAHQVRWYPKTTEAEGGLASSQAKTTAAASGRSSADLEFEAKEKSFEEALAAQKAAVAEYQQALADAEAQKAAGVAQAKAEQEAFARKQAEYEAELARARQAQADYEAKYGKHQ
jgi:hypothetical protein